MEAEPRAHDPTPAMMRLASYALAGVALFAFAWIVLYTLNPSFVTVTPDDAVYPPPAAPPDPAVCSVYAAGFAVVVLFLAWLVSCRERIASRR